jgi:hypothetical protein
VGRLGRRLKGKFGRDYFWKTHRKKRKKKICKTLMILQILKKIDDGFGQIDE